MSGRSDALSAMRIRRVTLGDNESIEVYEAADVDEALDAAIAQGAPSPYGAVLWTSGVVLAQRIFSGPSLVGKTVVDVGTGTGVCALAAARRGAHVVALDCDGTALERLVAAAGKQNLAVEPRLFDITADGPLPEGDLVVFADVLYEDPLAAAAAARALEAHRRGSDVLVGDPGRFGRATFVRKLAEHAVEATFLDVETKTDTGGSTVGILDLPAVRR